ncbi:MAG: hypothetical protein ACKVJE_20365 [Pseudomonadales bacterium]
MADYGSALEVVTKTPLPLIFTISGISFFFLYVIKKVPTVTIRDGWPAPTLGVFFTVLGLGLAYIEFDRNRSWCNNLTKQAKEVLVQSGQCISGHTPSKSSEFSILMKSFQATYSPLGVPLVDIYHNCSSGERRQIAMDARKLFIKQLADLKDTKECR